jgi:carnitine-CoA ligase
MTNILWKLQPGPQERDHRLRQCMMVPVPKDLYADIRQRWGVALTSVFGMSENFAFTRFLANDPPPKAGSAGRALGASELRIVDDDDRDLPAGDVGEILMRSLLPGAMMKGYYKMPEATAAAFLDDWFRTGDRGYVDADGYLYFVDRKKEAIRRRGENISAFEVETILARHPAIAEVAAVPVASDLGEDDVMVYVALKPGESLTAGQLVSFAADQMSYFMVPRYVAFIDGLPKTATEKIQKYLLKEDARVRRNQLWDREREGIVIKR